MNKSGLVKFGYVVALWFAFNMLFIAQAIHYYGLHKARYVLCLLALEVVLVALTALIARSRKVGLPALIALSLALGFIPYEYGIPFLLDAFSHVMEGCSGAGCGLTAVVRLVKSFVPAAAYFLLLLPMLKLGRTKAGPGSLLDRS